MKSAILAAISLMLVSNVAVAAERESLGAGEHAAKTLICHAGESCTLAFNVRGAGDNVAAGVLINGTQVAFTSQSDDGAMVFIQNTSQYPKVIIVALENRSTVNYSVAWDSFQK